MTQLVVEMGSDEAKLFRGMQKLIDQQNKMEAKFRATGAAGKKAGKDIEGTGKQSESAVGKAAGAVTSYIAGWASVGAIIGTATRALQEHARVSEQALASFGEQFAGRQKLRQVAESTSDFFALRDQADQLAVNYGTFQFGRKEAADLVFSARSEGFDAETVASLSGIIDPNAAAVAAGQVPKLFGGKLNSREAIALSLAAAGESRLNFEQLTKSLPKLAGSATQAGASPEEALAVASVLASKFESGDTAGTRIGALSAKLAQASTFESGDADMQARVRGLSGIGIVGAVDQLSQDTDLRTAFAGGNKELFEAINAIIEERDVITERIDSIKRERVLVGSSFGILGRKQKIFQDDADEQAALGALRSGIKREIAEETRFVGEEGPRKQAEDDFFTDFEKRGGNAFERAGANAAIGATKLITKDPEATKTAGTVGEYGYGAPFGLSAVAITLLGKMVKSNDEIAKQGQHNFNAAANAQARVNQ